MSIVFIELAIIAVADAIATIIIQRKLTNPQRAYEIQTRLKSISNELVALSKANAPKDEIAKKNGELTALFSEQFKNQMKSMVALFPLSIFIYYYVIPSLTPKGATASIKLLFFSLTPYQAFFIGIIFVLSFIISTTLLARDKKRFGSPVNVIRDSRSNK